MYPTTADLYSIFLWKLDYCPIPLMNLHPYIYAVLIYVLFLKGYKFKFRFFL